MHSIRAFAKIPRAVSKCGRTATAATSTTCGARRAPALPLTARSIGRLLPGRWLSPTTLTLLAFEMARQEKERRNAESQQNCRDRL